MARKRRWKVDPLTGIRYEEGSLMDLAAKAEKNFKRDMKNWMNLGIDIDNSFNFTSERKFRKRKPTTVKRTIYEEDLFNQLPPWARLLLALMLLVLLFWYFALPQLIAWIQENWIPISISTFIIVLVIVSFLIKIWKDKKRREAEKRAFEEEQKRKGLVKFVDRHGNEKWGTPEEVERWKKEDEEAREKESLFYRIVEEIKEFTPAREELRHEYNYQLNLHGWLKRSFPQAVIEKQTGASRPDIVIDDIAIEIKGPTGRRELDTIASKVLRYSNYYNGLIIVLFELNVNPQYYREWKKGLLEKFSKDMKIEIIEK
jgi:uncharacterized membrane protein (DUF485 family)